MIKEETDWKGLSGDGAASGVGAEGHREKGRQSLSCHLGSSLGVSRTESPGQRGFCIFLLLAQLVL